MKKFICFATVIYMIGLYSLCTVNAEGEYIENFGKINTYSQNQFTDVHSEWFAHYVCQVYETGLMYGNSKTTFNPNGNINNVSVIAIAARLHSIFNNGTENFEDNAANWYKPYLDYAINNGICNENIDLYKNSDRSFFVGTIGNAIKSSTLPIKNAIDDGDIPDVEGWYSNSVYDFYRAGILSGKDKYGTFDPYKPITRAEVAAILSRIVTPSERLNFSIEINSKGTYSIMKDDGSLAAFKQRAIVANLKVLLNGEPKGAEWKNDVYKINHPGIPGDNIHVSRWDIERDYSSDLEYIYIPNRYLGESGDGYTIVGMWNLHTGFRSFLKDYSGRMPDGRLGDLYLKKPEVAAYTETHTYDEYTSEAKRLINSVPYTPSISQSAVTQYINNNYGKFNGLAIKVGFLSDWKSDWYITINKKDMYKPQKRDTNNRENQTEFVFTPESEKSAGWCKNNFYKYIIALVAEDLKTPAFLAEISGYPSTKDNASIKRWNYSNNVLTIQWKYPQVSFSNPLTIYKKNEIDNMRNVNGLLPVYYSQYYDAYYQDDIENCFSMVVDGANVRIFNNKNTILFKLYSDKAIINGFKNEYDQFGAFTGYKDTETGKEVTITAPKRLYDIYSQKYVYYMPSKFIANTLSGNDSLSNNSSSKTEEEYTRKEEEIIDEIKKLLNNGYAKVCKEAYSEWSYYLEGHKNVQFRFGERNGIKGYDYEVSRSYNGPHIGLNLNSKKACVQVWYNGTEYGEQTIDIPEPKKLNGEYYLPADEILDALNEDGKDFVRKKNTEH